MMVHTCAMWYAHGARADETPARNGWLFFLPSALTSLFRRAQRRRVLRRRPLLQRTDRPPSQARVLVARGQARAEAGAAAAATYEEPPAREGGSHGTTDPINDFVD
jgi:hypothetical protein